MSKYSDAGLIVAPGCHSHNEVAPDYSRAQLSQVELACRNVLGSYDICAAFEAMIGSTLQPASDVEDAFSHARRNFSMAIDRLRQVRPNMLQDVYAKARVISVLASFFGPEDPRLLVMSFEVATDLVRFERRDPASA